MPTPGGPKSSTWSSASPRLRAPPRWRPAGSRPPCGWPTYSSRVRGRSDWSKPRSSSTGRPETMRVPQPWRAPDNSCSERRSRSSKRPAAVLAQRACRRRAPPRAASSRGSRAPRAGRPSRCRRRRAVRRRRRRAGRTAGILSLSSTTSRSAVFLPTPGMRVRRATSLSRSASARSSASMPERMSTCELRADARHRDEALEELVLARGEEAEECSASSRTWVWMRRLTSPPSSPRR